MFEVVESTVVVYAVNGQSFPSREAAVAAAARAAAEAQIDAYVTGSTLKPRAQTRLRNDLMRWEGWKASQ